MISNSDLVEATLKAAMGEVDKIQGIELDGLSGGYYGLYVIHSNKEGVLSSGFLCCTLFIREITEKSISRLAT